MKIVRNISPRKNSTTGPGKFESKIPRKISSRENSTTGPGNFASKILRNISSRKKSTTGPGKFVSKIPRNISSKKTLPLVQENLHTKSLESFQEKTLPLVQENLNKKSLYRNIFSRKNSTTGPPRPHHNFLSFWQWIFSGLVVDNFSRKHICEFFGIGFFLDQW